VGSTTPRIAFVSPHALRGGGGSARVFRMLMEHKPDTVECLHLFAGIWGWDDPIEPAWGERRFPLRPRFGRIERSRWGGLAAATTPLFAPSFRHRLERVLREERITAVHALPQGMDFWLAFEVAQRLNLPYYITYHDDPAYTLANRPEFAAVSRVMGRVWQEAAGRLVISRQMGEQYCRRYGDRPYRIVTDGLDHVPTAPRLRPPDRLHVYFLGGIHTSYSPNFEALIDALRRVRSRRPDLCVRLIVRGPGALPRAAADWIEQRPFVPEAEALRDLEAVDLLYLPLPFGDAFAPFTRLSLSTKMVSYLGTGLPILYHGPGDAAAAQTLGEGCLPVASLDPATIADALLDTIDRPASTAGVVEAALALARREFDATTLAKRFWDTLMTEPTTTTGCPL
jgi:glycosyltransferase involved in cell wall biosynthesis